MSTLVLACWTRPDGACAQSESPYAYLIRFEAPLAEEQHKVLWEVFADQPWLHRMATDAPKGLLKLLATAPLTRAQAEDLIDPSGADVVSMQDLLTGQFIGPSLDLGIGPEFGPEAEQNNAVYGTAKAVWLAQHPQWRRMNPPQDQLPHSEE